MPSFASLFSLLFYIIMLCRKYTCNKFFPLSFSSHTLYFRSFPTFPNIFATLTTETTFTLKVFAIYIDQCWSSGHMDPFGVLFLIKTLAVWGSKEFYVQDYRDPVVSIDCVWDDIFIIVMEYVFYCFSSTVGHPRGGFGVIFYGGGDSRRKARRIYCTHFVNGLTCF